MNFCLHYYRAIALWRLLHSVRRMSKLNVYTMMGQCVRWRMRHGLVGRRPTSPRSRRPLSHVLVLLMVKRNRINFFKKKSLLFYSVKNCEKPKNNNAKSLIPFFFQQYTIVKFRIQAIPSNAFKVEIKVFTIYMLLLRILNKKLHRKSATNIFKKNRYS